MSETKKGFINLIVAASIITVLAISGFVFWRIHQNRSSKNKNTASVQQSKSTSDQNETSKAQPPAISIIAAGALREGGTIRASAELSTNSTGLCLFGFRQIRGFKIVSKQVNIKDSAHCEVEIPKSEFGVGYWDMDVLYIGDNSAFAKSGTKFLQVK